MSYTDSKLCIVTGGGGFLGKALCRKLLDLGHKVMSVSRKKYPELESWGVQCVPVDLSDEQQELAKVITGADVVFHTAAKVEMWGSYADFYAANVTGTKNIIHACLKAQVPNFVYTSSPSVIANGQNLRGIDESYPYPDHYSANYPKTKALAEQFVLASNSEGFKTCSLRPHLIWGPGDTNLIPTVLERAKAGRLVKIGKGNNVVDFTYIDDCVAAHLCAWNALKENDNASGKAYFISQGDPMPLWDWINRILAIHGLEPVKRAISPTIAMLVANVAEFIAKISSSNKPPFLTKFLVEEMATDHYFDISQAREFLGFNPAFTMEQAFEHGFEAMNRF